MRAPGFTLGPRPRLLIRAGRIGAGLYSRAKHLRRILPDGQVSTRKGAPSAPIVRALRTLEAGCDDDRLAGAAHYTAARHVLVLSALIAEAGRLPSAGGGG